MGANDPLLMLPYSLSSHCDWNYKEKLLNHFCLHLHTGNSPFSTLSWNFCRILKFLALIWLLNVPEIIQNFWKKFDGIIFYDSVFSLFYWAPLFSCLCCICKSNSKCLIKPLRRALATRTMKIYSLRYFFLSMNFWNFLILKWNFSNEKTAFLFWISVHRWNRCPSLPYTLFQSKGTFLLVITRKTSEWM